MPLPVAHSLMGYAIAEATNVRLSEKKWINVSIFAALANLPDVDYLPGFLLGRPNHFHHRWTHSLGFALLIGLLGSLILWQRRRKGVLQEITDGKAGQFWPACLAISAAVFSHCVLDLFTEDTSLPYGMLLFWPLAWGFYDVSWSLFPSTHKSNESATFFISLLEWYNIKLVLREFLIMAPIAGLMKIIRQLPGFFNRPHAVDVKNTQVAKLGLLEVSPLPSELANRRSLTGLAEAEEQDETNE
ncbi:MAG: metal-dependent hydrolase [bacterium]